MPKGSPELTNARKQEIIEACKTLYQEQSFDSVSILKIAEYTSFTRTSIYNYFETKEEIFLAIFQQEYEKWAEQLNAFIAEGGQKSKSEVAEMIASSLEERPLMLKLLSMNLFHMEEKSREERLVEFKVAFGNSFKAVDGILQTYCPEMDDNARQAFLYAFFPFIYGLYPYTNVTEKQKSAMIEAGIDYAYYSVHDLAYNCLIKLLK
nr:TetR family transcriptional regulator [uncultured Ruminococcus sp.]